MSAVWFIKCGRDEREKLEGALRCWSGEEGFTQFKEAEGLGEFFESGISFSHIFLGEIFWADGRNHGDIADLNSGGRGLIWLVCREETEKRALGLALALRARAVNIESLNRFILDLTLFYEGRNSSARLKELAELDRLCTLGSMAAGIAHEINNPLAFIQASVQTMSIYVREIMDFISEKFDEAELYGASPRLGKAVGALPAAIERVNFGIARIARISKTLRDFAASSTSQRERCSLLEIVQAAVILAEPNTKYAAKVGIDISSGLPDLYVNAQEIEQVVLNLLINAAHILEGREDGVIRISSEWGGEGFLVLKVEDNGPGVKPTDVEAIFKPFYTTKKRGKGTGLGLAICRDIVRKHGGSIRVRRSESLGGACFEVRLPCCSEELGGQKKQLSS